MKNLTRVIPAVNPTLDAAIDEASKAFAKLLLAAVQIGMTGPATVDDDQRLPEKDVLARRPGLTRAWLRDHVPSVRGGRQRRMYILREVDSAQASSPALAPRGPRKTTMSGIDTDDDGDVLESLVNAGVLKRGVR